MHVVVGDGDVANAVVDGIEGSVATNLGHIDQNIVSERGECAAAGGLAVEPLGGAPATKCLVVGEIIVE